MREKADDMLLLLDLFRTRMCRVRAVYVCCPSCMHLHNRYLFMTTCTSSVFIVTDTAKKVRSLRWGLIQRLREDAEKRSTGRARNIKRDIYQRQMQCWQRRDNWNKTPLKRAVMDAYCPDWTRRDVEKRAQVLLLQQKKLCFPARPIL